MSRHEDYERWLTTRLIAYIWDCGDDVCNCAQPTIDKITPNMKAGFPWIHREAVWRGTFRTDGEDFDMLEPELKAEADKRGLVLYKYKVIK